jgi:hypothetical protein
VRDALVIDVGVATGVARQLRPVDRVTPTLASHCFAHPAVANEAIVGQSAIRREGQRL